MKKAIWLTLSVLCLVAMASCGSDESCSGQSEDYAQSAYDLIEIVDDAFFRINSGGPKLAASPLEEERSVASELVAPDCAAGSKTVVVSYVEKSAELFRLLEEGKKDEAKSVAEEVLQLRREARLSLLELKVGIGGE